MVDSPAVEKRGVGDFPTPSVLVRGPGMQLNASAYLWLKWICVIPTILAA